MGLNTKKYEGMIGNILAMDPLPTVNRAYHLIQQVEKQKEIAENMEGLKESDMSALNVNRQGKQIVPRRESKKEKINKKCEHCGMREHNPKGKIRGRYAANVSMEVKEEPEESPLDPKPQGSRVTAGKKDGEYIATVVQEVVKILNDKQMDHGGSSQMSKKIGKIRIADDIILKDVLYIPEFRHNLLSISKVMEDNNLEAYFDLEKCIFQDPSTKSHIAYGYKTNGLYKLVTT
ncbi:hypothetical protein RDABS01_000067 [Bienertia sinuspersici]